MQPNTAKSYPGEERGVTSIEDAGRRFFRRGQATGDVLSFLANEPQTGKLLELPAGDGITTQKLLGLGFDVVPADLFPDYFQFDEPTCVRADMGKPLPFEDDSFDYVLCQEGIEHIESPLTFTRECSRVLRVGGKLILTTPNVLHMSSRLAYFLVGHRTIRRGMINEHQQLFDRKGDELFHGHAWHWRYPLLRYILRLSGFRVYPPLRGKYSWFSVLLSIPFYPVLRIAYHYAMKKGFEEEKRKEMIPQAQETSREIMSHVLSRALLWGKRSIIVAEKESPTFLESDPYWSPKAHDTR